MKLLRHIPNTITSMNLLCGTLGVIAAVAWRFDLAFYLMLAAAGFDFLDGLSARLLNVVSPVGKELDSLSDMVSFGVLPSMMLYYWISGGDNGLDILRFTPLAIAVFSGIRLAKFNCDERQSENFIGLATPACAMICGSLVYCSYMDQESFLYSLSSVRWFIPSLSLVLALLLVSEIPMFSMKIKKVSNPDKAHRIVNCMRIAFLATIVVCFALVIAFRQNWAMAVFFSFIAYIVMNAVYAAIPKK